MLLAALKTAHEAGKIGRDPQADAQGWQARQRELYQHEWVVYAKTPLGGPAQVLEYLSRYTHRTAISNQRIRMVNQREVAFTVRGDGKGSKAGTKLPAARLALQMPAPNPQAIESAQAFMARLAKMDVGLCPCCKVGRLLCIAVLAGLGRLPAPSRSLVPECRGPP